VGDPVSELLTVQETADRLRLGKRTVERLISRGEIRSVLLGRRRLVAEDEVERVLRLAERRGRVA
jgi:excisionase family DNA binding protein